MAKVIRTIIDHQGNVYTDFSGFVNEECVKEEERLRRELSDFGLNLYTQARTKKDTSDGNSSLPRISAQ